MPAPPLSWPDGAEDGPQVRRLEMCVVLYIFSCFSLDMFHYSIYIYDILNILCAIFVLLFLGGGMDHPSFDWPHDLQHKAAGFGP